MESKLLPKGFILNNEMLEVETKRVAGWPLTAILLIISIFAPIFFLISIPALLFSLSADKTIYAITNQRVIVKNGLLSTNIIQCPISKIQNVDLKLGWMAKAGDIKFDTAGGFGKELIWQGVNQPQEVFNKISQIIHK